MDRDGDQIVRGAFAETIEQWQQSGKMIPLHWNHSGEASDVIGWADPATLREAEEGLYVKGQLDLENSEVAREAWRSMKANAVALSFGFIVTESSDRAGGGRELQGIDLFEISVVPGPANPDTRFLELKAATPGLSDPELWLPREAPQTKASGETIEEWVDRVAEETRPVIFESFEV